MMMEKKETFYDLGDSRWQSLYTDAEKSGICPDLPLPAAESDDYQKHRRLSTRMRAYFNYATLRTAPYVPDIPHAFVLFDNDGYLIKLTGNADFIESLKNLGICKGSLWHLEEIGPNAITAGLNMQQKFFSTGSGNYSQSLQDFAIYYSPFHAATNAALAQPAVFGGAALIVPASCDNPSSHILLFHVAESIEYSLVKGIQFYSFHESMGYGMLILDVNPYNGNVFTFYHSENLFDILGIPPMDIAFRPPEYFIDPLPKNKKLWAIITGRQCVSEQPLVLSIRGRSVPCILSTELNYQPQLQINAVLLHFTTQKKTNAYISKKIGNSALFSFDNIIGDSVKMRAVKRKAQMLANSDANVMLLGESGVGKDLFAQAIHNASKRHDKPFIAINCGALPRDLIASELFGYENGAFTGAKSNGNIGKFELADGGTIFLDEIGEMPLDLQATLLRVVEQKQFMRLGGTTPVNVDVRIISATNVNFQAMLEEKRFRIDLFYRLNTLPLNIPPLRDRDDDVILLAEHFIRSVNQKIGRTDEMLLSDDAKSLLRQMPWHGNVRDLQNLIECIVQLYPDPVITRQHLEDNILLPESLHNQAAYPVSTPSIPPVWPSVQNTDSAYGFSSTAYGPASHTADNHSSHFYHPETPKVRKNRPDLTREEIEEVLTACNGNKSQAARMLGIDRRAFYRHLERLRIEL